MRKYCFISAITLVVACSSKPQNNSLVTDYLKYSAFSWHSDQTTESPLLYLAYYINIDKTGKFILMRHQSFGDTPKYFTGEINDTLRQRIASAFSSLTYQPLYSLKPGSPTIYDGFTHLLDYKRTQTERRLIEFIPKYSPNLIKKLSESLDAMIYSRQQNEIDSFDVEDYKKEIKRISISNGAPFPKLESPKITLRSEINTATKKLGKP